jgi:hypothetical protein
MADALTAASRDVPVNANERRALVPLRGTDSAPTTSQILATGLTPSPDIILDGHLSGLQPGDQISGTVVPGPANRNLLFITERGIFILDSPENKIPSGVLTLDIATVGRTLVAVRVTSPAMPKSTPFTLTLIDLAASPAIAVLPVELSADDAQSLALRVAGSPELSSPRRTQPVALPERIIVLPVVAAPTNAIPTIGETSLMDLVIVDQPEQVPIKISLLALVPADEAASRQAGPLARLTDVLPTARLVLLPDQAENTIAIARLMRAGLPDTLVHVPPQVGLTPGLQAIILIEPKGQTASIHAERQTAQMALLAHVFGLTNRTDESGPPPIQAAAVSKLVLWMQEKNESSALVPEPAQHRLILPLQVGDAVLPLTLGWRQTDPESRHHHDLAGIETEKQTRFEVEVTYPVIGSITLHGQISPACLTLTVHTETAFDDALQTELKQAYFSALSADNWAGTLDFFTHA